MAIQSKILHWPMRNRHGHITPLTGHCSLTGFNFFKAWSQKTGGGGGGGGGGGRVPPRNYGTVCYINIKYINSSCNICVLSNLSTYIGFLKTLTNMIYFQHYFAIH